MKYLNNHYGLSWEIFTPQNIPPHLPITFSFVWPLLCFNFKEISCHCNLNTNHKNTTKNEIGRQNIIIIYHNRHNGIDLYLILHSAFNTKISVYKMFCKNYILLLCKIFAVTLYDLFHFCITWKTSTEYNIINNCRYSCEVVELV